MEAKKFDVIIIGGSYSGLAAGMALGRAFRKVLIIDGGEPCNAQTPHSHNFLSQDGQSPHQTADLCKRNPRYASFFPGMAECWGISILHCPFCHGYEVHNKKTGIIGNGTHGFELAVLISNWTMDLTLFTNGNSTLSREQASKLDDHRIKSVEGTIEKLEHRAGYLEQVVLDDGSTLPITAAYIRSPFQQTCPIPESLGCNLTADGYIQVDDQRNTTISGVFACGDNITKIRTLANAVASGTTAGMTASKQLISQEF